MAKYSRHRLCSLAAVSLWMVVVVVVVVVVVEGIRSIVCRDTRSFVMDPRFVVLDPRNSVLRGV